jgi:hypothetical protein
MKRLSNKDLFDKIRDKLEKKQVQKCNYIYEIKDKNKIVAKLKKNEELYINDNKIYARCLLNCEGTRITCLRHIEKENPNMTNMQPFDYSSYLSNIKVKEKKSDDTYKEIKDESDSDSYDEECELIGRKNGIEYFLNNKDEIICINSDNYGEIVGKKGDKLWDRIIC